MLTPSLWKALSTQAAMLMLLLNNVEHAAIHRLLQINHKAIEDMQKRLYQLRASWVLKKEKEIIFGKSQQWADVEADEATFDRMVKGESVEWEQWCGIIQRGQPSTLVLHRLTPPAGKARAPGPGAVRKVEWKPLAKKWLQGRQIILHTDSAKSYKLKVPDVLHDRVVHKKKRVKVGTKFRWIAPKYVEMQRHKVPGSKKVIKCKSGTQIIDRCWKFLKARLNINQHSRVGSQLSFDLPSMNTGVVAKISGSTLECWFSGLWHPLSRRVDKSLLASAQKRCLLLHGCLATN
jgi:hypothetical protein